MAPTKIVVCVRERDGVRLSDNPVIGVHAPVTRPIHTMKTTVKGVLYG